MKYATIYTNHDSGRGFAAQYTICEPCTILLNNAINDNIKVVNKRGESIGKIIYHNGINEVKSIII